MDSIPWVRCASGNVFEIRIVAMCLMPKYKKIRIHKYSICRNARKIQHVVYFWKEDCSRISSESRTFVQGLVLCSHWKYDRVSQNMLLSLVQSLSLSARFWLLINDFHMCSAHIRKLSHQKGEFINQVLGGDPENANCKLRRRVNSGISEQPSFDPVAGAGDLEPEQHCAHYSK